MDSVTAQLLLFLSTLTLLLLQQRPVGALRLLNVSVPSYLIKGDSARLECRFELDSDKSYFTVTWYKDNEHIYSYLKKQLKKHIFPMEGVDIDAQRSNAQILNLRSVNLNSTGLYACEVNIDKPPFTVVKDEAYMEIIVPPREDPKITGEQKIYASGDVLALNCTADYSYPAAQLQWFINDIPIEPNSKVFEYTSRGLHSSRSSLRLVLNPLHLSNDRIEVKCESTVKTSPQVKQPYVNKRVTQIFVQGHASLSSPSALLLFFILLMHILTKSKGL